MEYDFEDGNGPVPAHKHPNGGGWISDTATVSATAYVGNNARVCGDARVYGDALVYGNARVNSGSFLETPLCISRSDGYTFTLQGEGRVLAGCRDFSKEDAYAHWGAPDHYKHKESVAIVNALYAIQEARND